jgi:hypothetical protein
MMMPAIAAVAAGLLIDGSMRTEARGGSSVEGEDPSSVSVSADLLARTSNADGALRFGVSPSAVLAQGRQLFVRGFGEAELRFGRRGSVRVRQALGYGSVDLSPVAAAVVAPAGPLPVQPPPGSRFVSIEESNTSVELEAKASRRLRVAGSAAWVVSGGADAEARASLPLSRGPAMRAHLDWRATRLDTLGFELAASDQRYSNEQHQRATVASLTAVWRMRTGRGNDLSLSLGPGVGRAQQDDQPATTVAYAVGALDFRATPFRDLSGSVGASVEPLGDPLSGEIVERASVRAVAVWDRHRGVGFAARLNASAALTSGTSATAPRSGDLYLQGELSAMLPLSARSSLVVGARAAFLTRPVLNQPEDQWVAFLSYAAQLSLLR